MTALINALVHAVATALVVNLSRTASGASAAFDVSAYEGQGMVLLDAGAASAGTDPTLDVKITHCDTSGGTYVDVPSAAFAQVTTTAGLLALLLDLNAVKQFIKVDWTIGGTASPAFPFGAGFLGIKKYS